MRFTPKTEAQINEGKLLKPGYGDFQVIKVEEKYSEKAACDMLILTLKVWDESGKEGLITDYILNNDRFEWKLRHFFYSAGIGHLYEKGDVSPEDLMGAQGQLIIITKKDKTGQYPDQSAVKDYIDEAEVAAKEMNKPVNRNKQPADNFIDDDLTNLVPAR
jgi:hypothetical protein